MEYHVIVILLLVWFSVDLNEIKLTTEDDYNKTINLYGNQYMNLVFPELIKWIRTGGFTGIVATGMDGTRYGVLLGAVYGGFLGTALYAVEYITLQKNFLDLHLRQTKHHYEDEENNSVDFVDSKINATKRN